MRQIGVLAAALSAAHVAAGAASHLMPPESRPLVSLCLITLLSMVAAAAFKVPLRRMIAALVAATVLSLFAIFCWRRLVDPMATLGQIPPSMEPMALAILGVISVALASVVAVAFLAGGRMFRFRWLVFGAIGAALLTFCVMVSQRLSEADSPQHLLQRVVLLEQSADPNGWAERQELSTVLSFLGRQREARVIPSNPDAVGHELADVPDPPTSDPPFVVTPWRDAMTRIAAEQRLVLIMEDHAISEHRAWIEQTMALFRAARFTHYFAETIAETGSTLKARGYPTSTTGFYTLDPRFGNLVRTAIRLDFEIGGYDLGDPDFDRREAFQAATLAERFAARPDSRMVVHAGHGHVFKHEVRNVGRYMAARLWEQTGVEPFTIWQLSNELPNDVYRALIRQIGPIDKPVLLIPPPQHVSEALFPESSVQPAVDAVVVHPPRLGREPTDRRGAFTDHLTRVPGVWRGQRWPVVIAAIPDGEPDHAIALDQILLRDGETEFELWLPHTDCVIRVWSLDGPVRVDANIQSMPVRVEIGH
ncbi:MAG TPA: hypothetical protein VM165_09165 [Planctomycetaceae bacterium]|nr:hypothetical protein [Planctomycetaceae bacterium]